MSSEKRLIETAAAPKALGPYSQAVAANGFIFCAGQIPLDPKTGALVGDDVAAQTERVCENIRGVLAANGMTFSDVVKTTVFLKSMDDFAAMNEVYGRPEYFGAHTPARSTVEVARLPRDVRVEIEIVALAGAKT